MFDYIQELDANVTNGTLYDSGIDIGEIQRLKNLANYFSNSTVTTVNLTNGTALNVTFENITLTELRSVCYNTSANGTLLNELPMINGLCGELSVVDFFGTSKGIDSLRFNGLMVNGSDNQYGINGNNTTRRRLFFGNLFRTIVSVVVDVFEAVVEFVEDVISILTGDINKRIFDLSLSINAQKTMKVSGGENTFISPEKRGDADGGYMVGGSFEIDSGVEFFASIHCDLVAKYKIFDINPSFDYFKLSVGGSTQFKAFIDLKLDGTVSLRYEIARVERRMFFMLGPIPIIVRPYAAGLSLH